MMNKEEFNKAILKAANDYVKECEIQGEDPKQVEEMIRYDFMAGADVAYELITKNIQKYN